MELVIWSEKGNGRMCHLNCLDQGRMVERLLGGGVRRSCGFGCFVWSKYKEISFNLE